MFSAKIREKSIGKMRSMRLLAVLLIPAVALIMGATAPEVWAQDDPECWWNIEFNATDLDVGVRGFFDYEHWKELEIENPRGRTISEDESEKELKKQGKAEWFFESAEPMLGEDDYTFDVFLDRFKEGDYEFEAEPLDGGEVECIAEFTHVIPCPPEIVENPFDNDDRTISWAPVTMVVDPDVTDANIAAGEEEPVECIDDDLVIDGYEVIVEGEYGELSITLPADATSFEVPIELGDFEKFEVLAIEESGNQTITEVEEE